MDSIELGSSRLVDGLGRMLEVALGEPHEYSDGRFVDVPVALMIIEIAKLAEDRVEWFPCGKWASIQAIQAKSEAQLKTLFGKGNNEL